ncbi:tripartite tricarboxylate transporter substrate binding protein [Achromobacter sp. GG226]|uniref:Bug family tripartite tricarboxylate transporter substrate binding protein n=1 Tax=Verticiella alkaliphila TaxID=2779529 RepID=UPI001C0B03F4|nr:tripartite tricarboxylate transporter substrate binding protein [Verticiella sp. GG226]MBU4611126.1 tripartite tricarboxylate transporter substrate binding protein [Verticiella sp. GG226]
MRALSFMKRVGLTGRRHVLSAAAATLLVLPMSTVLAAAGSGQPVTIVLGQGPGSGSDVLMRLLSGPLAEALGQPVVIENRTGGGGIVAHESILRDPLDGHHFIYSSTASLFVVPHINSAAKYRYTDFLPVAPVNESPFAVLVPNQPQSPRTLAELVVRLGSGQAAYASAGTGTMTHLGSELLLQQARVDATHVPYRGSGQALTDLAGGQVAFATDSLTAALPFIQGGQLRALAVSAPARLPAVADVPTMAEAGFPALKVAVIGGLFAPRQIPPAAAQRMAAAVDSVLRRPDIQQRLLDMNAKALLMSPTAFAERLAQEAAVWEPIARSIDTTGKE